MKYRLPLHMTSAMPLLFLCCSFSNILSAQIKDSYNGEGLQSLTVNGNEWLKSSTPGLWKGQTSSGNQLENRVTSHSFNLNTRTLTQTYAWGRLEIQYRGTPEKLTLDVKLTNTGTETLTEVTALTLLQLNRPGEGTSSQNTSYGMKAPHLAYYNGSTGAVLVYAEMDEKPFALQLRKEGKDRLNVRISLGGNKLLLDNQTNSRPIPAGATDRFVLNLRLAGPGVNALDLAEEKFAAYRDAHPSLVNWPDRRPILRLFFGGGATKEEALRIE